VSSYPFGIFDPSRIGKGSNTVGGELQLSSVPDPMDWTPDPLTGVLPLEDRKNMCDDCQRALALHGTCVCRCMTFTPLVIS